MRPGDDAAGVAPANRRRAVAIAAAPAVVCFVVVAIVVSAAGSPLTGLIAGAVVGALAGVWLWRGCRRLLLQALRARPVEEDDVPGPATLVEGLCASMGLAFPDLFVVDDPLPNALVVGRSRADAALVLTSGLLDMLGPVELEGVLAHELAHVKRNDVGPATMAAALLLVAVVFPGGSGVVHALAGRGREFATDRHAVEVTRYPPGLRHALAAMTTGLPSGSAVAGRGRVWQVTRWLWTAVLPDEHGRWPEGDDAEGELDAPSVRAAALDEW